MFPDSPWHAETSRRTAVPPGFAGLSSGGIDCYTQLNYDHLSRAGQVPTHLQARAGSAAVTSCLTQTPVQAFTDVLIFKTTEDQNRLCLRPASYLPSQTPVVWAPRGAVGRNGRAPPCCEMLGSARPSRPAPSAGDSGRMSPPHQPLCHLLSLLLFLILLLPPSATGCGSRWHGTVWSAPSDWQRFPCTWRTRRDPTAGSPPGPELQGLGPRARSSTECGSCPEPARSTDRRGT